MLKYRAFLPILDTLCSNFETVLAEKQYPDSARNTRDLSTGESLQERRLPRPVATDQDVVLVLL